MFAFDKGRTIATTQDGASVEFRQLQDFAIDFKVNLKDLYGRGQDAVYIASGKRSVSIKGTYGDITSESMGLLLNATQTSGIVKMIDPAPVLTVPSSAPYTSALTLPASSTFNKLLIVYDVTNPALAIVMKQISSGTPAKGEFLFSNTATAGARTYTVTTNFAANDTVTINGVTLTAKASGATGNQFNVGTDIATSITNIVSALSALTAFSSVYTITSNSTTITLTETLAGGGNTPTAATVVGTGVMTSGSPVTSAEACVFTFSSDDASHSMQVLYNYNLQTGTTLTLANNLMGSQKPFQLEFFTQLAGAQIHLVLPRVMAAGSKFDAKMEDYTKPSLDAKAMSTAAGILGYMYLDDAVGQ